jgi:aspartate kinase
MKHIQSANIPLRIKNVKSPQGPGTMIYPSENGPEGGSGSNSPRRLSPDRRAFMDANGYEGDNQSRRTPTAITSRKEVTVMNIVPNGSTQRYQFLSEVLSCMSSRQVVPDLMCTSEQSMSFAIHDDAKTGRWEEVMSELTRLGNVRIA